MLLIVFDPATKAPRPPTNGETKGHPEPARPAMPVARAMGIFSYPAAPPPVLRKTCTIGTVKTRAVEAARVVLPARAHARFNPSPETRCHHEAKRATRRKTVDGR